MRFNNIRSSFEKKSDLLLSKLNVANDDKISILPTYVPKLVSIPIRANNNSLSISNSFSTEFINFEFEVTILVTKKGTIHNDPIISFKGIPILEEEDFVYGLGNEIRDTSKSFSLNNTKQYQNLIDALKITCRKYSKEKTGKKPFTNINIIQI